MIQLQYIEEIKKSGLEVIEMNHGYRINGCVDIYKGGTTIFDKVKTEYHKFKDQHKLIIKALELHANLQKD